MDRHGRQTPPPGPWGRQKGNSARFARRLLIVLAVALTLLLALLSAVPPVGFDSWRSAALVRLVLVLALVAVGIAASQRRLTAIAGDLAIWGAILLALVIGYSYRFELQALGDRALAEIVPGRGLETADHAVVFRRGEDGQFAIDATVDGARVRFLVDTGASDVILTRADAIRLGVDPDKLDYSERFETANGTTRGAPIRLRKIGVGTRIRFDNVRAYVNDGDLDQSLLGMGALARLSRIEISGDSLTIRP